VSVAFANGDSRVTLTPQSLLAASSAFTLTIGTVTDLSGIAASAPVETHFTTGAGADLTAPIVTAVSPPNGAQNVATSAIVQITFNERMNPLTLTRSTLQVIDQSTGVSIAGDVVVSGDGLTAAFIPAAALAANAGYYIQGSGWSNLAGQQTSVFTSFRTAAQPPQQPQQPQ
jgi:large repetitive protein